MANDITLVRHTEVARRWRGRCYGVSDVGLSRAGAAAIAPLAQELAALRPEWIIHSDLTRTRRLAIAVARSAGCTILADPAWRERDFGTWEGQSWNAIYRASGNAMDGMIEAPDKFRPGGGETTLELAVRVATALTGLPEGRGIVVTHGGPIASLWVKNADLPRETGSALSHLLEEGLSLRPRRISDPCVPPLTMIASGSIPECRVSAGYASNLPSRFVAAQVLGDRLKNRNSRRPPYPAN